jgi:hypothetical protein
MLPQAYSRRGSLQVFAELDAGACGCRLIALDGVCRRALIDQNETEPGSSVLARIVD